MITTLLCKFLLSNFNESASYKVKKASLFIVEIKTKNLNESDTGRKVRLTP